jgi:hypothetical protein
MATLVGFGTFAALAEELISEKISRRILSGDQGMLVWWSIAAGVHVEPHSHANEQIVWMLKGKMEFRLGSEQRVCGPGGLAASRRRSSLAIANEVERSHAIVIAGDRLAIDDAGSRAQAGQRLDDQRKAMGESLPGRL